MIDAEREQKGTAVPDEGNGGPCGNGGDREEGVVATTLVTVSEPSVDNGNGTTVVEPVVEPVVAPPPVVPDLDAERKQLREQHRAAFARLWDDLDDLPRNVFKRLGYTTLTTLADFGESCSILSNKEVSRGILKESLESMLQDRLKSAHLKNLDLAQVVKQWGFSDEHVQEWLGRGSIDVELWPGDVVSLWTSLKSLYLLAEERNADLRKLEQKGGKRRRATSEGGSTAERPRKAPLAGDINSKTDEEIREHVTTKIRELLVQQSETFPILNTWTEPPVAFQVHIITTTDNDRFVHVLCKCGTKLRLFFTNRSINVGAYKRHLLGAGKEPGSCRAIRESRIGPAKVVDVG